MRCPYCQHEDTKVTDSRATDDGASIRRRRECISCKRRFTTYEIVEEAPLIVVKRNGGREQFNRQKLLQGILRACDKRNVPVGVMEDIVTRVERRLRNELVGEVPSDPLVEIVLEELKTVDQVAYVRFASVYRKFDNVDSFLKELNYLKSLQDAKK